MLSFLQYFPNTTLEQAVDEQTVDELNRYVVKQGELRCPEYAFKLAMNPWQHPKLDKNIHHVLALVASLCNTCGGVIFLTADDPETIVTKEVLERFQSRLTELILEIANNIPQNRINFTQVPFPLGRRRPWIAIHLKGSELALSFDSAADSNLLRLRTDLCGFIRNEKTSDHQDEEQRPSPPASRQATPTTGEGAENTTESDGNGPPEEGGSVTSKYRFVQPEHTLDLSHDVQQDHTQETRATEENAELTTEGECNRVQGEPGSSSTLVNRSSVTSYSSDGATNLPLDLFYYKNLDWSKNKKDWESYVHGETPEIETIINSSTHFGNPPSL